MADEKEEFKYQKWYLDSLKEEPEVKPMSYAVKFYDEEKGIVEGLGIPYGGPVRKSLDELGKDLTGEYFSDKTDFRSEFYDGQKIVKAIKALYHHGLDETIKDLPIGEVIDIQDTPQGKWVKVQLDKANKYYEGIKRLIQAGKLLFSSGADPDNIKKAPDGFIEKWPYREESLTFAPANPLASASFKALMSEFKIEELNNMDPKEVKTDKSEIKPAAVKADLPSVPIKPDPAIPAETQGHAPGESKAAPPECPVKAEVCPKCNKAMAECKCSKVKAIKCASCGKAVELPPEVIAALTALQESITNILSEQPAAPVAPAGQPEGDKPAASSQPGVSQGMAPENHGQAKAAETSAQEAKETPKEEATEEKKEQDAMKSLLDSVESKVKNAVEEATKPLKERIATLESAPFNDGPARRAIKSSENPKMGNPQQDAIKSKMDSIDKQLAGDLNPAERMRLSREKALLEMPHFNGTV